MKNNALDLDKSHVAMLQLATAASLSGVPHGFSLIILSSFVCFVNKMTTRSFFKSKSS